jgi:uncharacterized protein (DUF433 family)
VESVPGKVSGAWVFRGTLTPVLTAFENLQDVSVDELMQEFGVTRGQVQAVLQFAAQSAEAPVSWSYSITAHRARFLPSGAPRG